MNKMISVDLDARLCGLGFHVASMAAAKRPSRRIALSPMLSIVS
jgi:hypothetical protein